MLESNFATTLTVHHPQGDIVLQMDVAEDGGMEVSGTKHRNAVTRRSTARGGTRERADMKLTAECTAEVWAILPRLEESAGIDRCTIVRQPVNGRGVVIAGTKPKPITGVLGNVSAPNYDINSNDVAMLELEVSTDE